MASSSSQVANALSGMVSGAGSTRDPVNAGKTATPQSGVVKTGDAARRPVSGPPPPAQTQARVASRPKAPKAPQPPAYSAQNPPLGTAPPAAPHPGVIPIYPDARSPQPTLMPNGVPVFPPPPNVMGAGMGPPGPRVPLTFTPGMTGLLGR